MRDPGDGCQCDLIHGAASPVPQVELSRKAHQQFRTVTAGLFYDTAGDATEHWADFDIGWLDLGEECFGEGAVRTGAIARDTPASAA